MDADILVENKIAFVKTLKDDNGYPGNLTENQVVRLIYFFGSRKSSSKSMKGAGTAVDNFTDMENKFVKDAFEWFGFVANNLEEKKRAYRALIVKFKAVCDFLRMRPAYITQNIYRALDESGYKAVLSKFVLVIDKDRKMQLRSMGREGSPQAPIMKFETGMLDFQNLAMDKIMMMVEQITPDKVKKAPVGTLSKAVRDVMATLHMIRQGSKNPNFTLTQINVGTSDSKEKLSAFHAYTQRNREIN